MNNNISLSQDELEKLGVGELIDVAPQRPVWIIKSRYSVIGGRCFSYDQALLLFQKAMKDYPGYKLEIVQIR